MLLLGFQNRAAKKSILLVPLFTVPSQTGELRASLLGSSHS
jgi:hypothetical protein